MALRVVPERSDSFQEPGTSTPPAMNLRRGIPLHEQISSWLRDEIRSESLPIEAQLPSEHELCQRFGVSRVTVRRALQTLEAEGLIHRRQGLGSFVSDARLPQGLVHLTDFAQDMARAGVEASSRVLGQFVEPCPAPVAEHLDVDTDASVVRLDRLRLGDEEPVAVDRTWLAPYYGQLLDGHDLTRDTLYRILEKEYGIPAMSGRYRITADSADDEVARLLEISSGDALLVIERTTRTIGEKPIYFQRRSYRSDRVAYELELARDPSGQGEHGGAEGMPLREFEVVFRHPTRAS